MRDLLQAVGRAHARRCVLLRMHARVGTYLQAHNGALGCTDTYTHVRTRTHTRGTLLPEQMVGAGARAYLRLCACGWAGEPLGGRAGGREGAHVRAPAGASTCSNGTVDLEGPQYR